MSPDKTPEACIVGCGRMGQRHAEVIKSLGFTLTAVADIYETCCRQIIDNWKDSNIPDAYNSLEDLLKDHKPDVLIIATTADSHSSHALHAIKAGIPHILLEKPVATSLLDCMTLQKACEQNQTKLAVNHQMRYLTQYQMPKTISNSEQYGGFQSMTVTAGNFGMAMNGTHYLEAFRFIADEAPKEVSAWFDSETLANPRGEQFEDMSGCIRVTTESGKRLYIDTSADQGHGVQVTYMSRNGRLTVDELSGTMTCLVRMNEHRQAPTSRYGMPATIEHLQIPPVELVNSTKAVLQDLIEDKNYPTLSDATLAVKTLVGAYHSHRQGGIAVDLNDIDDTDPEVFPWA